MASAGHIATRLDLAIKSLQETGPQIAALLNIQPPDLTIWFRDRDLLQAEQLQELAQFQCRVIAALEAANQSPPPTLEPVPVVETRAKRGGRK
jgi:hypothetical protein